MSVVVPGSDPFWSSVKALGGDLALDTIKKSFAICEPLHEGPDRKVRLDEDLAYGRHPRHRIDLYRPAGKAGGPLLLFVHGGGYVSGDKRMGPFFGNLGRWAASNGYPCAVMNYRLAPDHVWPSVQEDIAAVREWWRVNAARFDVTETSIVLMGHSAGAGHCAGYAVGGDDHGLAGLILMSGTYDLPLAGDFGRTSRARYYGDAPHLERERSSIGGLAKLAVPVLVIAAEFDPAELHNQALAALSELHKASGHLPSFARLHGHNHYTEILSAGSPYAAQLHQNIVDFLMFDCAASTAV